MEMPGQDPEYCRADSRNHANPNVVWYGRTWIFLYYVVRLYRLPTKSGPSDMLPKYWHPGHIMEKSMGLPTFPFGPPRSAQMRKLEILLIPVEIHLARTILHQTGESSNLVPTQSLSAGARFGKPKPGWAKERKVSLEPFQRKKR